MVGRYYILKDKKPILVDDFMEYALWMNDPKNVIIEKTNIGDIQVSTVFLGIDIGGFWHKGSPLVFETMIFGGEMDTTKWNYETWEEAVEGHKKACDIALELFSIKPDDLKKIITESLN
jgi:hypothetical protein